LLTERTRVWRASSIYALVQQGGAEDENLSIEKTAKVDVR